MNIHRTILELSLVKVSHMNNKFHLRLISNVNTSHSYHFLHQTTVHYSSPTNFFFFFLLAKFR